MRCREGRRSEGERQRRSEWKRHNGVEGQVEGDTQRREMRNGGGSPMNWREKSVIKWVGSGMLVW